MRRWLKSKINKSSLNSPGKGSCQGIAEDNETPSPTVGAGSPAWRQPRSSSELLVPRTRPVQSTRHHHQASSTGLACHPGAHCKSPHFLFPLGVSRPLSFCVYYSTRTLRTGGRKMGWQDLQRSCRSRPLSSEDKTSDNYGQSIWSFQPKQSKGLPKIAVGVTRPS
ncbi:hypothetical protein VTK26DRAFT_7750 [Humicola hyalothermophila]